MKASRMKPSIVIPLLGKKLTKKGMHEYALKAYHYGYEGIEPELVPSWEEDDMLDLMSSIKDIGLQIPAIGTGLVCNYGTFSDKNPNRKRCLSMVKKFIKIASKAEASVVISTVKGWIRNKNSTEQIKTGMKECILFSKNFDVPLLIEPLNRYETDYINTAKEALELIEELDATNVGILLDTFHMNIEEASIPVSIRTSSSHIFHVHIADSNRRAPGFGHLNFDEIFSTLKEVGYSGFVSAEIFPLPSGRKATEQTINALKMLTR